MTTAKVKLSKKEIEVLYQTASDVDASSIEFTLPMERFEFDAAPIGYWHDEHDPEPRIVMGTEDDEFAKVDLWSGTPLYLHPQGLPDDVAEFLRVMATPLSNSVWVEYQKKGGKPASYLAEKYGVEVRE